MPSRPVVHAAGRMRLLRQPDFCSTALFPAQPALDPQGHGRADGGAAVEHLGGRRAVYTQLGAAASLT